MAKPFATRDAKRLVERFTKTVQALEETQAAHSQFRSQVRDACQALVSRQVLLVLAQTPVEEINRDKRGFRVKPLRDAGFLTLADLARAETKTLADINGISDESAVEIKQAVAALADQARQGAKLRLSTDDKNPEATGLVKALFRYSASRPAAKNCETLLSRQGPSIACASRDLAAGNGLFKWLFASGLKKQKATDAYSYLSDLAAGSFLQTADQNTAQAKKAAWLTADQAWQEFQKDPVSFYQALEEIEPGLLGNDDTLYGLPEELAQSIGSQEISLEGLNCTLRRYQLWGVKYVLHQQKVLLGDEMGLGKTVQAIAAMVSLRNDGGRHFLVVCPASVMTNWCREIGKMSDLPVVKIHGPDREEALAAWLENGGVAVTTYETTGTVSLPQDFRLAMMVVDEAHYVKNPEAQRTGHIRRIGGVAQRILFMTGTALENRVEEMVSLIGMLQPEVASRLQQMQALSAAPQFREAVTSVYYRRRREDVLTELPELTDVKQWCDMTAPEEAVYEKTVLAKNFAQIRRVSWNVEDLADSSKAQRLLELVEKAREEGRKVIVFSFFLDTIARVTQVLGDRCTQPINGSVPPQRRQQIVDEFDKAPAGTVLPAQIQAGGTGLNIQSASMVILCEPQFKPSIENQAISRAYRMGQTRNVLVYRLLCDDTVDEKILRRLEDKQAVFDAFADESLAAAESLELDDKGFGSIVQEEIRRIEEKNAPAN